MKHNLTNIEDFVALPYTEWVRADTEEGGFVAGVQELSGCLADGDTRGEALERLQDAKRSWLITALEAGDPIPMPSISESYSGRVLLRISRSLHRDLARQAEWEGVSLNQLCATYLSRGLGVQETVRPHEAATSKEPIKVYLSHSQEAPEYPIYTLAPGRDDFEERGPELLDSLRELSRDHRLIVEVFKTQPSSNVSTDPFRHETEKESSRP